MPFLFDVFVVQFALAIGLFFLINWIGKHSFSVGYVEITLFLKNEDSPAFNYLLRVLTPLVYLLFTSTILYYLGCDRYVDKFYRVSIYYITWRLIFNIITGRVPLLNWTKQILYWVSIVTLSVIIDSNIIKTKKNLYPDFTSISNELWIIILVFVFQLLNGLQLSAKGTEKRKDNYITSKYNHFKNIYGGIIKTNTQNEILEIIAYTILIYEDFNRPKVSRWLEYLSFLLFKKRHSLGVMQFPTESFIGDTESVDLGTKKLFQSYQDILYKTEGEHATYYGEWAVLQEIIGKYNGGSKYYDEVTALSETVKKLFYPETTDTLFPLVAPAEFYGSNPPVCSTLPIYGILEDIQFTKPMLIWKQLIGAHKWKNNILVEDGMLYLGSGGQIMAQSDAKDGLYKLDIITGNLVWFFAAKNDFLSIILWGYQVFGGALDGSFWALTKEYGTPIWKIKFPTAVFSKPQILSFINHPDLLFVTPWKGNAYLMEPETGQIVFTLSISGKFRADSTIVGNLIILPEESGHVYFLQYSYKRLEILSDVSLQYANPHSESGYSNAELYASPVIFGDLAIIGFSRETNCNHPPLAAIDIYTKKISWFSVSSNEAVQTFGNIRSAPCLSANVLYYGNSSTSQLIGISALNGDFVSSINLGVDVQYQWSHTVEENGIICIARGDGILYFIHRDSNKLISGINLNKSEFGKIYNATELITMSNLGTVLNTNPPKGIIGNPLILNGVIYIGNVTGELYAIKLPTLGSS